MAKKQDKRELTQEAGRKVAAAVQSVNRAGWAGTPGSVLREATAAMGAASAAEATGREIRQAAGMTSRELADLLQH